MGLPFRDDEVGLHVLDVLRPTGDLDGPVAFLLAADTAGQKYHLFSSIHVDPQTLDSRIIEEPGLDRRRDDRIVDVLADGTLRLRRIPRIGAGRPRGRAPYPHWC